MNIRYHSFQKRWEVHSESITDNKFEILKLRQQVMHLEQIIVFLITKLLDKEPLSIQDDAIKQFLQLPDGKEQEVLKYLKTRVGTILGKVHCPTCDAVIKDIEGVYDEKCAWCGTTIQTER